MKYKSKLKVPLMLEQKKLREKEIEIAALIKENNKIEQDINNEEEKHLLLRQALSKGEGISSSFFVGSVNHFYVQNKNKALNKIKEELKKKNLEHQMIKKKLEAINDLDKKREKEFYVEIEKKEWLKAEELRSLKKHLENKKGGHNGDK